MGAVDPRIHHGPGDIISQRRKRVVGRIGLHRADRLRRQPPDWKVGPDPVNGMSRRHLRLDVLHLQAIASGAIRAYQSLDRPGPEPGKDVLIAQAALVRVNALSRKRGFLDHIRHQPFHALPRRQPAPGIQQVQIDDHVPRLGFVVLPAPGDRPHDPIQQRERDDGPIEDLGIEDSPRGLVPVLTDPVPTSSAVPYRILCRHLLGHGTSLVSISTVSVVEVWRIIIPPVCGSQS